MEIVWYRLLLLYFKQCHFILSYYENNLATINCIAINYLNAEGF